MSVDYIFVYGSLRSEFDSPAQFVLRKNAELAGKATFQGKLYKVNWYPGVVESDGPKDIVYGEVYKIINEKNLLSKLDRYEGCSPDDPEPHAFIREKKTVRLQNGDEIWAWIYIYVSSTSDKEQITSGDYFTFQ